MEFFLLSLVFFETEILSKKITIINSNQYYDENNQEQDRINGNMLSQPYLILFI